MSDSRRHDRFSNALAGLERLVDVWGDLSATKVKKLGVDHLVIQRVKSLVSPRMMTPYSMTVGALERLAAFRNRITHLNIRNKCFEGNVETLVITIIKSRAALGRVVSLSPDHVPWEYRFIEALEEWLMIRNILMTSFGIKGAVVQQLDDVIDNKTLGLFFSGWTSNDTGILIRRLELCEKLMAVPTVAFWIQYDILPQILKEQIPSQLAIEDNESSAMPVESAANGRMLQEKNKQLEATVGSLEQEIKDLKLAEQNFEITVESSNEQLDVLRLSHAELSKHNTMLNEELEKIRLLHMGMCDKNNELEAEKATSSKRFALSKKALQGTVRKLKDEIEVLQSTLPPKAGIIDSDSEVYDKSFQSEALKAKELLAEAEEDLAMIMEANDQLVTEHKGLHDTLAALLCDKAAIAEECENLNFRNTALKDTVKLSHRMVDRLKCHCDELTDGANTRGKQLVELVSANARLESSLSKAKDDHAALSKSNEKLQADSVNKEIELNQAADFVSRLMDEGEKCKEEKALLEEHLAEANQSLDQATSTITATNMHNLTAENLRLEKELEAANDIIGQIRSTLLPPSTPSSTVHEASTAHESPDTATADLIDFNEDFDWTSGAPMDPYLMGDTESDAWSTMLTPPSGLDANESWYFDYTDQYGTLRM